MKTKTLRRNDMVQVSSEDDAYDGRVGRVLWIKGDKVGVYLLAYLQPKMFQRSQLTQFDLPSEALP